MSRSDSGGVAGPTDVSPQPPRGIEPVLRQQPPAIGRDELHGIEDVLEYRLADEVVEVDADPAGLDALAARQDLLLQPMGGREVDAQQPMTVGTGARAAAPRLDAEQVVEQRHHQVVMQVATAVADREADDRQAPGMPVTQDVDARHALPALDGPPDERPLPLRDGRLTHAAP